MSIQDDYYDLKKLLEEVSEDHPDADWCIESFDRIWDWGCENESDNDKLRPIVNGIRNAISLMFEKEENA